MKQANTNLAPQIGIAWDPKGNGKTVIRAGAGLFDDESCCWNNVLFDRPLRLRTGAFNAVTSACWVVRRNQFRCKEVSSLHLRVFAVITFR